MKTVQILMSTYNGQDYIKEQIDSILNQSYQPIRLLIRDDGSKDGTFNILKEYQHTHENISVYQGQNIGVNKSFFDLLKKCGGDYVGFCDQDDFWLPEKVEAAVKKLEEMRGPALYCGAKTLADEKLKPLEKQQSARLKPGFGNALIESICSGCTLLMNRELTEIIKKRLPEDVIHHDWWCYMAATYLGSMYYDENSYIYYRQHGRNEVGASGSALAMIKAKARDLKKRHGDLKEQLKDFAYFYHGNEEKDQLVRDILEAEHLPKRITILFDRRWYRQSRLDNWVVRALFLFNRML